MSKPVDFFDQPIPKVIFSDQKIEEVTGKEIRGTLYTKSGARIMLWNKEVVYGEIDGEEETENWFKVKPLKFSVTMIKETEEEEE
jgi:hypothetical protein